MLKLTARPLAFPRRPVPPGDAGGSVTASATQSMAALALRSPSARPFPALGPGGREVAVGWCASSPCAGARAAPAGDARIGHLSAWLRRRRH